MRRYYLLAVLPILVAGVAKGQDKNVMLDKVFKNLNGTITFEVWHYEGNTLKLKEVIGSVGDGFGELSSADANWRYDISSIEQSKDGSVRLDVKFRLEKGEARDMAVAASFHFSDWRVENYVMILGAVGKWG